MIEVEQTITLPPHGNCMQACLASIFELELEDAPTIGGIGAGEYWRIIDEWLEARGWWVAHGDIEGAETPSVWWRGYWIAAVLSPGRHEWPEEFRDGGLHAIVMRDDAIAWDPSPKRERGHDGYVHGNPLMPLDPARFELR